MNPRPISLILAAGLMLVIGVSGMAAGGGLLGVALNGGSRSDVHEAGLALGSIIAGYGFSTVLAGVGLIRLRRWAWRIGSLTMLVGLVALIGAIAGLGALDPLLFVGLGFWGFALICLILPSTRAALNA